MQKHTEELNAEIRQSFDRYSLLDVADFDKMSDELKGNIRYLNKTVDKYLKAGIPWMQIKKILLGTTPAECGINLEWSVNVVNLYPYFYMQQFPNRFGMITTKDPRLYDGLSVTTKDKVNGESLFYDWGDRRSDLEFFFKQMSPLDMLKVANMRVDIDHISDEKKRQKKIQEMFVLATQMEKNYDPSKKISKREYAAIWKNNDGCEKAFSMLQNLENGMLSAIRMDDSAYERFLLLAAHRVNNVEQLIKESSHVILGITLSPIDYVQQKLKAAELWKDSGLPIPDGILKRRSTRLPHGKDMEDWTNLHRNTFFKNQGRG